MAKEIEVKIYGIDVQAVQRKLESLGAKIVKDVLQRNVAYRNDHTKRNQMSVRVRYEQNIDASKEGGGKGCGNAVFTVKTARRVVRNHKVQDEFETAVDGPVMERALQELGLRIRGVAEMKRTYYSLHGVSVEICRLPDVPAYLEIEGDEAAIAKAAQALGFSRADYDNTPPRQKFNIPKSKKDLTF